MDADFSFQRAVFLKFSPAITRGFIHLVVTLPGKLDAFGGFSAVEATRNAAEGELTAELTVEGDVRRLHQVEEVFVPQCHLGDPPFAGQRALALTFHAVLLALLWQIYSRRFS